jgi:hypothetical protein
MIHTFAGTQDLDHGSARPGGFLEYLQSSYVCGVGRQIAAMDNQMRGASGHTSRTPVVQPEHHFFFNHQWCTATISDHSSHVQN